MMKLLTCVILVLLASPAGGGAGVPLQTGQTVVVTDPMFDGTRQLVSFADLDYPVPFRSLRIEGVVVIVAKLDKAGHVVDAAGISGPELLIPHAAANAKKWRFKPNRSNQAIIVYDFDIDDGVCHDRDRTLFLLRHENFAQIRACTNVVVG